MTFPKSERLRHQKIIKELFSNKGSYVFLHPFKIVFFTEELSIQPSAILVSVPKRNFKRAVHRNRIKRLIKEAYRLQKDEIFTDHKRPQAFAILYISKQEESFVFIRKRLKTALMQMVEKCNG